ncbi:MAG: hydrogenase maturation nickel metallochaperone HypA [Desulfovibrionaceae bacterium]
MHEASLVMGILRIVQDEAAKYGSPAVVRVSLGMGLLACIEEQTLRGCFEIFAENTVAEKAELIIEKIPLKCQCDSCHSSFVLHKKHFLCPHCGSTDITFEGGHGCTITAMEVES